MDIRLSWTSAPPLAPHERLGADSDAHPPMVIHRSPTGFVVACPLLEALVGAPALPLPYTPDADPALVVAALRRNNPTRSVRFDERPWTEHLDQPCD